MKALKTLKILINRKINFFNCKNFCEREIQSELVTKPFTKNELTRLNFYKMNNKQIIIELLKEYDKHFNEPKSYSLDFFLRNSFKGRKSMKEKEKTFIYENIYDIVRNKILLETITMKKEKASSWNEIVDFFFKREHLRQMSNVNLPFNIKHSFPLTLFSLLQNNFGEEKVEHLCKILNERAPLTIRTNLLKISRVELLDKLKQFNFQVAKTQFSPLGITIIKDNNNYNKIKDFDEEIDSDIVYNTSSRSKINIRAPKIKDIFREGYFEIQDEASQLTICRLDIKQGDQILDYCCGSGGKALALASLTQNKGQIYLHDVRKKVLLESRKRMKRAGVQNFQIINNDGDKLRLQFKMDWVILDVPCSGTGTLRRNPENKYKFSLDFLKELKVIQFDLLEEALLYVKPTGRIVYITCSLLHEENLSQVVKFCSKHNWKIENNEIFETFPKSDGMDGFFSCVLIKA